MILRMYPSALVIKKNTSRLLDRALFVVTLGLQFLNTQPMKRILHPKKRMLVTFAAIFCMMALMPMTARAQTQTIVNVVRQEARITRYSTLYVGEVLLD